jgi:hypothetical protein
LFDLVAHFVCGLNIDEIVVPLVKSLTAREKILGLFIRLFIGEQNVAFLLLLKLADLSKIFKSSWQMLSVLWFAVRLFASNRLK